ncbi:TPA: hypothetical protein ACWM1T_001799 [Legionella pneumophila]|nr:hypothetical protein [Legionella pneumophila]
MKTFVNLIKLRHKKIIMSTSLVVLVLIALGLSIISKPAPLQKLPSTEIKPVAKDIEQSDAFKEKINSTLSVIDKRLSLVQREMEKAAVKDRTDAPDKALKELSNTVVSFKEEAERSLIKSHEENEALARKIQALQEVIASLKGSNKSTQYLDKKALPFEIVAIDSVNEEPVLALRYNYNHMALEKGDMLAGWKVVRLDYAKQFVEFDDEKGVHVKLSLSDKKEGERSWA